MRILLWLISLIAFYAVVLFFVQSGVTATIATIFWGVIAFSLLGIRELDPDTGEDSDLFEESEYAVSGMDMDASPAARGLARSQDRG